MVCGATNGKSKAPAYKKAGGRYNVKSNGTGAQLKLAATKSNATSMTPA